MKNEGRKLRVRAYAKINLGLEVLGRRPDGLHEIRTVLQTIDLADTLTLEASERIILRCRGIEVQPDNLILQAAYLLKERAGVEEGCAIECIKRIPVAAGLGGGSADAAATLCGLVQLWTLRHDPDTLSDLAGGLGADVPFFLRGGTALASGTGRQLQPLEPAPRHWVVLVPISAGDPAKTGAMYERLIREDFTDGSLIERQVEAIRLGILDYSCIESAFSQAASECWPEVGQSLDLLRQTGAVAASVCGSGPSAFGLYRSRAQATIAVRELRTWALAAQLRRFAGWRDGFCGALAGSGRL